MRMPVSYPDKEVTVMSRAQRERERERDGGVSANQKIGSKAALSFSLIVIPIASARVSVSQSVHK